MWSIIQIDCLSLCSRCNLPFTAVLSYISFILDHVVSQPRVHILLWLQCIICYLCYLDSRHLCCEDLRMMLYWHPFIADRIPRIFFRRFHRYVTLHYCLVVDFCLNWIVIQQYNYLYDVCFLYEWYRFDVVSLIMSNTYVFWWVLWN